MKHMNESERALSLFGIALIIAAIGLSIATEVSARRHLAEYRRLIALGAPATLDPNTPSYLHHIGFEQQTLAGRWSFPDGHAALGTSATLFGLILVAVPRAVSRRRLSGEVKGSPAPVTSS